MKILFLEDRPDRQRQYLPNRDNDVEFIQSFGFIFQPKSIECKRILSEINDAIYVPDIDVKIIFIHKSALTTKGLNFLDKLCRINGVSLVCFSGGISQVHYSNDGFQFLSLNSSDFYSNRLISFLSRIARNEDPSLLEIANSNWKLSYLFLAKQLINTLESEPDEDRRFIHLDKLSQIKKIVDLEELIIEKINFKICDLLDEYETSTYL